MRIHRHTRATDGCGAFPCHAPFAHGVRWKVEDPVGCGFVQPSTWLEQIAHHGERTGLAHASRAVDRSRQAEHSMPTAHEDLDQFRTDEPAGSRDKRRRCVTCHVRSVEGRSPDHHRQRPHNIRTPLVRMRQ